MDLESVDLVMKTARSVRRKLDFDRPVPLALIKEAISVAVQAPTSQAGENWRFIVVTDPDTKSGLASLYRESLEELRIRRGIELKPGQRALIERMHEIPCLILVCVIGKPGVTPAEQVAFYGSILPAAWSLMLALRARSLGTTWTTLLSAKQLEVATLLGIPGNVTQTVMLPVGYHKNAVLRVADRKSAEQVTFHNLWGKTTASQT